MFCLITYLLPPGVAAPDSRRQTLCSISCSLSWFDGQHGSGHPDPDFGKAHLKTATSHATAPPTAGTSPATGSTTAAERAIACRRARSGMASGSPPRRTSQTPFATTIVSRPRAASNLGARPASSRHSTPSGSRPSWPLPCTPSCSPGRPPASTAHARRS